MRGCDMYRERAAAVVAKGVISAAKEYQTWTRWLGIQDAGVENLVSTHVARALHAEFNTTQKRRCVYLESSYRDVELEGRGGLRRGPRRETQTAKTRMDAVVYDGRGYPMIAVEVKRTLRFSNLKNDVFRMRDLLLEIGGQKGSLKAGIVVGAIDILKIDYDINKAAADISAKIEDSDRRINCLSVPEEFKFESPVEYCDASGANRLWYGFAAAAFALDLKA